MVLDIKGSGLAQENNHNSNASGHVMLSRGKENSITKMTIMGLEKMSLNLHTQGNAQHKKS